MAGFPRAGYCPCCPGMDRCQRPVPGFSHYPSWEPPRHGGWPHHHSGGFHQHHGGYPPPVYNHYWARGGGCMPSNAVFAGNDKDGGIIYAGRAYHDGDLLPAKVTPRHGCAYVSFAGEEHRKNDYEILCCDGSPSWIADSDGRVPMRALAVGKTRGGETLYMGRARHDGTLTPGKIHPSHRVMYIPYDGREISFSYYEVLVL